MNPFIIKRLSYPRRFTQKKRSHKLTPKKEILSNLNVRLDDGRFLRKVSVSMFAISTFCAYTAGDRKTSLFGIFGMLLSLGGMSVSDAMCNHYNKEIHKITKR